MKVVSQNYWCHIQPNYALHATHTNQHTTVYSSCCRAPTAPLDTTPHPSAQHHRPGDLSDHCIQCHQHTLENSAVTFQTLATSIMRLCLRLAPRQGTHTTSEPIPVECAVVTNSEYPEPITQRQNQLEVFVEYSSRGRRIKTLHPHAEPQRRATHNHQKLH
jgi:hypothetical protein